MRKIYWYNILSEISKEIVAPLKEQISEENFEKIKTLYFITLPQDLQKIADVMLEEEITEKKIKVDWSNIIYAVKYLQNEL